MPPSIVWALSIIDDFFMPPRVILALSIVKDFFMPPRVIWHLPPSVGCDPSQGYFKKNLLGSKGDCK